MDEFHHFARTNAWIAETLRSKHDYIYAVAPITAAPILTAADIVLTDSKSTNNLYPNLLKVMKESRNILAYKQSNLFQSAMKYLENVNLEKIYMYTGTEADHPHIVDMFSWGDIELVLSPGIPNDFGLIGDYLEKGGRVYPFKSDLEEVKNITEKINNNTICILTRNFQEKQNFYNSKMSKLNNFVKKANQNGLNVINVGSPPLTLSNTSPMNFLSRSMKFAKNRNFAYSELNNLTYSQTLAVATSSLAWQIVPHAGGFACNIQSQARLIVDGPEFCKTDRGEYLFDVRKRIKSLVSLRNFNEFISHLRSGEFTRMEPVGVNFEDRVIDLAQ